MITAIIWTLSALFYLVGDVLAARKWYATYPWALGFYSWNKGQIELNVPLRALASLSAAILWPFLVLGWLVVRNNATVYEREKALKEREKMLREEEAALDRAMGRLR